MEKVSSSKKTTTNNNSGSTATPLTWVELYKRYVIACNNIARAFARKQGLVDEGQHIHIDWVANDPGTCFSTNEGETIYDFHDTITDFKENAPVEEIDKYNEFVLRCHYLGITDIVNYRAWIKHAPRISDKTLTKLEEMKAELDKSIDTINYPKNTTPQQYTWRGLWNYLKKLLWHPKKSSR